MTSKILHILLLLCIATLPLSAQEEYADTVFHDNVDRTADDFIIASVVVASPGEEVYSAVGHACLRLQCPQFALDYIFSNEAEDAAHNVLRFFAGKLMMGTRAIETGEYVNQYKEEGRGVKEYILNLPPTIKQRLWQQMDERVQQPDFPYDYMNQGCAVSVLSWLDYVIDTDSIQYGAWGKKYYSNRKSIVGDQVDNPWVHAFLPIFIAGEGDNPDVHVLSKVMTPSDLVEVVCQAQAYGKPLANPNPHTLLAPTATIHYTWFTPLLAAILLLIFSAVNLKLHTWVLRIPTLLIATLIGLFVCYLVFISDLTCTEWNWLIIPFCPLPLLLWKWRRLWALPYSTLILIWCIGILLYPHQLVDLSHVILALAVGMVYWEVGRVSHS